MTIDERIDRLTARHEALAQSVELLVAEGIESRKRLEETRKLFEETVRVVQVTSVSVEEVSKTVDLLSRSVFEIAGAIKSHEARINRLEGRAA